jgi:hypothetical protein
MGKDEYFQSFRVNANNFMCTLLPGISNHPQIQYSPGSHRILRIKKKLTAFLLP